MNTAMDMLRGWPVQRPLAALWGRRWVVLAEPAATFRVELSAGRARSVWLIEGEEARAPVGLVHEPLRDLGALLEWGRASGTRRRADGLPGGAFPGGWIGYLSYDLGRVIEPAVERGPPGARAMADRDWPLAELHWCPGAAVVDRESGEVCQVGVGTGGRGCAAQAASGTEFRVGPVRGGTARGTFEASVERAIEYIRAGDMFQANLAHRLSAPFEGSTRGLFAAMCKRADPWHGAYIELAGVGRGSEIQDSRSESPRAVVSCSPELFLRVETRRGDRLMVVTRPMKGTRPASGDPGELLGAGKDRAELNMIIDLMRNDLGRVCIPGTVRVEAGREIERHGGERGVWQATATVSGEAPERVGIAGLLGAAFPAGSVTGAPKIRAMQVIDGLEPVRRGPYCGSIGWIGNDGSAELNVAIRTALVCGEASGPGVVRAGVLDYSVGAGIVAESDPASEWQETLDKAGVLRDIAAGTADERAPARPKRPAASR